MSLTSQALINGATKQAFTSSWQNVQSSNLWINLGAWSQNKGVGLSAQTYPQETLTGSAPTQTMATGTLQNGSNSGFITVRNTGAADYMFTRLSFLAGPYIRNIAANRDQHNGYNPSVLVEPGAGR